MKTKLILLTFLSFLSIGLFAQPQKINIKTKQNEDKSVTFNYEKEVPGSYTLILDFDFLENAYGKKFVKTIDNKIGEIVDLEPINPYKEIRYTYRYWHFMGKYNPKFDSTFVYLLPLSTEKDFKVYQMTNLNEQYFNGEKAKNWTALLFETEIGDTVFATRKGQVIKLVDEFEYDSLHIVSYKSKVNELVIEHEDGTLARYSGIKKNSFMVKLGQTVYPRTPLGVTERYDKSMKGQLCFMIYYLCDITLQKDNRETLINQIDRYGYVNPFFLTEKGTEQLKHNNNYRVKISNEIITKEFTRRELKKITTHNH